MQRNQILKILEIYRKNWIEGPQLYQGFFRPTEQARYQKMVNFIRSHKGCFNRSQVEGHITGSVLITNKRFDKVLLTLHRKIKKWLQLGGHADGHPIIHEVAYREAKEESGLERLSFFNANNSDSLFAADDSSSLVTLPIPFDIDIHLIPKTSKEKQHYHYDIRYLLIANDSEKITITPESIDLKWWNLDEAYRQLDETSMTRQFSKLFYLKNFYQNITNPISPLINL